MSVGLAKGRAMMIAAERHVADFYPGQPITAWFWRVRYTKLLAFTPHATIQIKRKRGKQV